MPRRRKSFAPFSFSRGDAEPPAIVAGEIKYQEIYDLAVYFPAKDFPLDKEKTFWPERKIDLDPASLLKDYLFLQGVPKRFSRFTSLGGNAAVSELLAYGAMARYREEDIACDERVQFDQDLPDYEFLPSDFLQPHQFAINFSTQPRFFLDANPKQSKIDDWSAVFSGSYGVALPGQKPQGAFGLSGSPVWRLGASGRNVNEWTPECRRLVGIVTGWNEEKKILIATLASRLLESF